FHVANGAIEAKKRFASWIIALFWRLKCFELSKRLIRRIYMLVKPSAVQIEINHSPIQKNQQQDDQPNRHSLALTGWQRPVPCARQRLVHLSIHFAGALVAGTLMELVPEAVGALVSAGPV